MTWFTKKVPVVVTQEKGAAVEIESIGWISVKERIPEYGLRVLVADPVYGVVSGHRTSQNGEGDIWSLGVRDTSGYSIYPTLASTAKVSHWMPLPPAP